MDEIDFRSDTVTWPTPAMRQAMANARVGDDVYGEDPTVNQLEQDTADLLGHEAGLFVSSGTQGNLIAMLSHTQRGDEAIMGEDAHVYLWEAGGIASLGGVLPKTLPTDARGQLHPAQVEAAINPDNPHKARTRLICTENSSGGNHGAALAPTYFANLRHIAQTHNLRLHLDGARLLNATTALRIPPTAVSQHVDSVSLCLSKGLCAPVGSVLVGSHDFIHRARRLRKVLGGGMRQAGILAAAGLIALHDMSQRLDQDHQHAQLLAHGLADIDGIVINPAAVETNLVFFSLREDVPYTAPQLAQKLYETTQIHIGGYGIHRLRAVTHYWVGEPEIEQLLAGLKNLLHG